VFYKVSFAMTKAKKKYRFDPDYAVPPCHSIQDICEEKKISLTKLCKMLLIPMNVGAQLLDGQIPISVELAKRLTVLGATQEFWVRRQRGYEKQIEKLISKSP